MQNTELKAVELSADIIQHLPNVIYFFSDHSRMCCFNANNQQCYPRFNIFSSCEDLIRGQTIKVISWGVASYTTLINVAAALLIITNRKKCIKHKSFAMTLAISDAVTAACFLSLCIADGKFHGEFGLIADQWRESFMCNFIEFSMFVSSNISLVSLMCYAIFTTKSITQLTIQKSRGIVLPIVISAILILLGLSRQITLYMYDHDVHNYFCFPFTFSPTESTIVFALQWLSITFNLLIICISIISYAYLFRFLLSVSKNVTIGKRVTKSFSKKKIATMLAMYIIISMFSFTPSLITQSLVLMNVMIDPNIFFFIVIVTVPLNTALDPIFFIFPNLGS